MIINIIGILFIIFIIAWFWIIKPKIKRAQDSVILIEVKDGIYLPSRIEVPANKDITLAFLRKDASPCTEYVVFEKLNIHAQLPLNKKHEIYLGKLSPGKYIFTCQMRMVRGELIVVE